MDIKKWHLYMADRGAQWDGVRSKWVGLTDRRPIADAQVRAYWQDFTTSTHTTLTQHSHNTHTTLTQH